MDRRGGAVLKRVLLTLAAIAALLLPGTPAWAHNQLLESTPSKGATLKKAPTEISLKFMQKLNPEFTTIVVTDEAKARVPASAPEVDGVTGTLPLTGDLTNGTYTVAYRVVSVDGHTVQGSYTFTLTGVAPPATTPASPAPSAAPSTAAPSTAAPSTAAPSTAAPSTAAPSTDAPSSGEPALVDAAVTDDDGISPGGLIGIGAVLLAALAIGGSVFVSARRRKAGGA